MTIVHCVIRHRNRGSATTPWGSWVTDSDFTYDNYEVITTKAGSKTPGHRKMANSGLILPVNPYAVSTECRYRMGSSGTATIYRKNPAETFWSYEQEIINYYPDSDIIWHNCDLVDLSVPSVPESLISQAVNEAVSQAQQSLVMLPVTALEARETLQMLKNSVRRLLNFATFIRELSRRRRESFSALWLEYRLGWTPFYYDLIGYINLMNGKLKNGDRQHGSGIRIYDKTDSFNSSIPPTRGWSYTINESYTINARVRGFALAEVTDEVLARYGLNPVLVVWESITLSWLLDKFVSVGSWLSALTGGMSGFDLKSSGYSVKVTLESARTITQKVEPESPGYGAMGDAFSFTGKKTVRSFNRYPDGGGNFPGFNRHFSAVSITDILALIAQWNGYRI